MHLFVNRYAINGWIALDGVDGGVPIEWGYVRSCKWK